MRKILLPLLCALLALCLCSCGRPAVYTVEHSWGTATIDTENQTITVGEDVYRYKLSGHNLEITYPDGSIWYQDSYDGNSFSAGWSEDYEFGKYIDGDDLAEALRQKAPGQIEWKNPLPSLLLLGVGIFALASPRSVWYLEYGWHYKDAEPSELALFANRAGGVVAIIAAVIIFFV